MKKVRNKVTIEGKDLTFDPGFAHTRGRLDGVFEDDLRAFVGISASSVEVQIGSWTIEIPSELLKRLSENE